MALLEDAAELAVTAEADAVFAYLEMNTPWLKGAVLKNNAARFSTLRICNSLLRRLSKTSAASLCGCALSHAHVLRVLMGLRVRVLCISNSLLRRLSKTSAASLCGCALSCAYLL